jgi:hypothetical protein
VAACARCRALVADLEAIRATGRELEASVPEVPERLWVSLRAQLEAEGLIREVATECLEFEQQLESESAEAAEAQGHLAACGRCRALVSDLKAITAAAPSLEADVPELPERIWVALRNQLEAEGLIREAAQPTSAREDAALPQSWTEVFGGLFGMLRRPALAAAYAAALVVAVLMLPTPDGREFVAPPLNEIAGKFGAVEREVKQVWVPVLQQKNPVVATTYRDNLAIVDKFIVLCEKTVRENPNDRVSREYLVQAYQQKAELLSALAERGVGD